MNDQLKGYVFLALFLITLWGVTGVISGEGFMEGIFDQIEAMGEIIFFLIVVILIIGVIWFLVQIFKDKEE